MRSRTRLRYEHAIVNSLMAGRNCSILYFISILRRRCESMRRASNLLLAAIVVGFIAGCGTSATTKKEAAATRATPESPAVAQPKQEVPGPTSVDKAGVPDKAIAQKPPEPGSLDPVPPVVDIKPSPVVVPPPLAQVPATPPLVTPAPTTIPSAPTPITKKGPNHFVITVAEKTPAHPNFGKGHHLGFLLDNVPGKPVVLKRGEVYEFDVQTDPLHDVYFSTSPMGWGGGTVTEGIKGQFTYRGLIVVSPTENTPDIVYYQCRNHSSMGGKVAVVNKSASSAEINRLLASNTADSSEAVAGISSSPRSNGNDAAKQKLMLAELMLQSKSTKAVAEGGNESAKSALASATSKVQAARQELGGGHNSQALALAEEALKLVTAATRSTSNEEAAKLQHGRYVEALDTLKNFQDSHKQSFERTVKKRGAAAAVDYDHVKVDGLIGDARALSDKGQHEKATQLLVKAERLVTQAIQAMLNAQTIVYDLNFESPSDEYEYERKRFISYEELIPVALEEKKPAEAVVKLMDTYVVKGRARKTEADGKAKAGNYPEAISLMLAATEEIQRALRLAGVSQ